MEEEIIFDVETCSEVYKHHIRESKYGDITESTTDEYMIFIYKNKTYKIKFKLQFSFDFENGFNYTYFSNFKSNIRIKDNVMEEFQKHIKETFVTLNRLSC